MEPMTDVQNAVDMMSQRAGYPDKVEIGQMFETRPAALMVGRMIP